MAEPTTAKQGQAFHILHWGHVWQTFVNDSYADEAALGTEENIEISAPLLLFYVNESRTIDSISENWASPGLNSFTRFQGGFTCTRWARVMNPPGAGNTLDEPIRQKGWGTNDLTSSWFEVSGWGESLPDPAWGGAELNITVYDPNNIYGGIFVEGRSIAIRVKEYEDGSIHSDTELFCGFVLECQAQDKAGRRMYQIRAGTIEAMYRRIGHDASAAIFIQEDYNDSSSAYQPGQGPIPPTVGLVAANFAHVFFQLTVGRVIAHLMLWHMWVRINGTNYRLAQVVNFRRDYWNDIPVADAAIPALPLNPGNIMDQIAGMLAPYIYRGYSTGRWCDFVVSIDHEFKATPDPSSGSIDEAKVYSKQDIPGQNNVYGQVITYMAPSMQTIRTETIIEFKWPSTPDANRSVYRPPVPFLIKTQAGGDRINKGLYDKINSRQKIQIHLRGAPFGPHNTFTVDGSTWVVERVIHVFEDEALGSHETVVDARRLSIS